MSPQLIFTKESKGEFKQYILVQLDSTSPKYMIKKKMKNYLEHFFTNEWEENTGKPFPTILFTCKNLTLMIYAKCTMKRLHEIVIKNRKTLKRGLQPMIKFVNKESALRFKE